MTTRMTIQHILSVAKLGLGILAGLLLCSACSREDMAEPTFRVCTMPMSTGLMYEVFPATDEQKYTVMVLPEERCRNLSNQELQTVIMDSVNHMIDFLNMLSIIVLEDSSNLLSMSDVATTGYVYDWVFPLNSESGYAVCVLPLNDALQPFGNVHCEYTATKPCSDIEVSFDVHSHGRSVCIIPSDNDVDYFYDVERKVDILDQYYGSLDLMLWENVTQLECYGMLDIMLKRGKDSVNVFETLSPVPGDTMYMVIDSYDDFFLSAYAAYYRVVCISEDSIAVEKQEKSLIRNSQERKIAEKRKKILKNLRMSKKSSTFATGFVR